jgi:dihydrofolate reductase
MAMKNRDLILGMSVSLDGFVAGPNGETDWIFRNSCEASLKWLTDELEGVGLHAMGRRSYEGMADYWPISTNPLARAMNEIPKAVFSRSGRIAAPTLEKSQAAVAAGTVNREIVESWKSPIVGGADLAGDIARLKAEGGKPINALGGATFATSLLAANLVDVLRLAVHPEVLGRGLSIFAGIETPIHLKLVDLKEFETGIVVKTYRLEVPG